MSTQTSTSSMPGSALATPCAPWSACAGTHSVGLQQVLEPAATHIGSKQKGTGWSTSGSALTTGDQEEQSNSLLSEQTTTVSLTKQSKGLSGLGSDQATAVDAVPMMMSQITKIGTTQWSWKTLRILSSDDDRMSRSGGTSSEVPCSSGNATPQPAKKLDLALDPWLDGHPDLEAWEGTLALLRT